MSVAFSPTGSSISFSSNYDALLHEAQAFLSDPTGDNKFELRIEFCLQSGLQVSHLNEFLKNNGIAKKEILAKIESVAEKIALCPSPYVK